VKDDKLKEMIYRVDKTRIMCINNKKFILDYIRIKYPSSNYYVVLANVLLNEYENLPDYAIRFDSSGTMYYYMPCIGFEIKGSGWEPYFVWSSLTFNNATIEMLRIKEGVSLEDPLFPEQTKLKFKHIYTFHLIKRL